MVGSLWVELVAMATARLMGVMSIVFVVVRYGGNLMMVENGYIYILTVKKKLCASLIFVDR